MLIRESINVGGKEITFETGRMAKQADGAIIIRCGDTVVMLTAVASKKKSESDFLPLTVDYVEKMYAAGRIPGSYFRREARPASHEILTSRLIDRPIRPLFDKKWRYETQIIGMVISADRENSPDVLAMTAASAALMISDIPWAGPIAGIRVGRIDGQFIANPTETQQAQSDMNIVVAASREALVMVEGACKFVAEKDLIDGLMFAQQQAMPILDLQEKLRAAVGKAKRAQEPKEEVDRELADKISKLTKTKLAEAIAIKEKQARYQAIEHLEESLLEQLGPDYAERGAEVISIFEDQKRAYVRNMVLDKSVRIDGRGLSDIRPISCEVGLLPRVHGSSLFTRGETQGLVTTTLGTHTCDQRIETLLGEVNKGFLLHYNFPPFSTGEVKRFGSPGRREIGHGNLAERALSAVLPEEKQFPYAIRIVSEILESNGSSSMATVCGGSLALMDAGVPTKSPVAGIAMGLINDGDKFAVLSDILGDEDHLGDMDFKVCGTSEGITAIQMDIKLQGLPREVLSRALDQAKQGRMHILGKMAEAIETARTQISPFAPRILTIKIKVDRIRDVIGPGGKMIRAIQDESGAEIEVQDDGTINIASVDESSAKKALNIIQGLTAEAEMGVCYKGRVKRIADFGAFIEILPGTDGLCHISELERARVKRVEDVVREGDEVVVKVINIDRDGKIRLSRKEALDVPPEEVQCLV